MADLMPDEPFFLDEHDEAILAERRLPDPCACPWRCAFVAETVAERNEHSLSCEHREESLKSYNVYEHGIGSGTSRKLGARLHLDPEPDDDYETPRQRAAERRARWQFRTKTEPEPPPPSPAGHPHYAPPPGESVCEECGEVFTGPYHARSLGNHRRYKHPVTVTV